jgi:8-oxo-dGTP pyrophosphatase MutT (NUDIX family)
MADQTKLAAGVIPVRREAGGWRILVLRAYRNWDFPKGMLEPGEEPLAAARRETAEETGLRDLEFAFGEGYKETLAYAGGKVARYYLAETQEEEIDLPISPELGRPEHHEWRWVTFDEAEGLLPPRLAIVLEWVRETLEAAEA